MRVLFVAWGWPSHFLAMVPLAWACRLGGHEVRVASQPALADTIARAGLAGVSIGRDLNIDQALSERPQDAEETLLDPVIPLNRSGVVSAIERCKWLGMRAHFAAVSDLMVDDLIEYVGCWRPDVIVWEASTYAGTVAAGVHGVPAARLTMGLDVMGHLGDEVEAQIHAPIVDRHFARFGLSAAERLAGRTIDQCPPSLRLPTSTEPVSMRHVPYSGGGLVPGGCEQPGQRVRVCITWGVSTEVLASRATVRFGQAIDALADLDAEVLVLGATIDPTSVGPVPPNVRITGYVPLTSVLPSCSVIVHHGGGGTTLTAAALGVPQVLIPQIMDQGLYAHQVHAAGAGMAVQRTCAAEGVRGAVEEVLSDPRYAAGARKLAEENASQPAACEVVHILERAASLD